VDVCLLYCLDNDLRKKVKDSQLLAAAGSNKPLRCPCGDRVWLRVFWFYLPGRLDEGRTIDLRLHHIYAAISAASYSINGLVLSQQFIAPTSPELALIIAIRSHVFAAHAVRILAVEY
jgi:hypothetical protein